MLARMVSILSGQSASTGTAVHRPISRQRGEHFFSFTHSLYAATVTSARSRQKAPTVGEPFTPGLRRRKVPPEIEIMPAGQGPEGRRGSGGRGGRCRGRGGVGSGGSGGRCRGRGGVGGGGRGGVGRRGSRGGSGGGGRSRGVGAGSRGGAAPGKRAERRDHGGRVQGSEQASRRYHDRACYHGRTGESAPLPWPSVSRCRRRRLHAETFCIVGEGGRADTPDPPKTRHPISPPVRRARRGRSSR
jgi:hypothetical protein